MDKKINIISHYQKLFFYTFKRFKKNNYQQMREYFAQILISEVEEHTPILGKKVLDVGGARGEFCKTLYKKKKCDCFNLDPFIKNPIWKKTINAYANKIPFNNDNFDLVICRGVLEHIPTNKQQQSINEMYRVTKSKGMCYIVIPPWYNPHAGHNLKPFHLLPFKMAKFFRQIIFRNKINANSYAEATLYPITFRKMIKMIKESGFIIKETKDTHFRLHILTRIPILREVAVPAVSFILIKE